MMSISLIAVGNIKEKYLEEGIKEYLKRLKPYANVDVIEIKEAKAPDDPSPRDIKITLAEEGRRIEDKLPEGAYIVALAIEGKAFSSTEFASMINDIGIYRTTKIAFVIGGSYGLDEEVKSRADTMMSFSRATFPHQLMRLMFLEQLYRAFMIINGRQYHK